MNSTISIRSNPRHTRITVTLEAIALSVFFIPPYLVTVNETKEYRLPNVGRYTGYIT